MIFFNEDPDSLGKEFLMSWIHLPQQPLKAQIRWLINCDLPGVLDIERQSFETPWCERHFLCCLRERNCIGMVAEYNNRIIGFMIYELFKAKLQLLNFAVAPEFRRQAVGSQMIEKLVDKLSQQRRKEIVLEVRESNLAAQIFFKKQGFKAVLVLHNYYGDVNEDAYVMVFRMSYDCGLNFQYVKHNFLVPSLEIMSEGEQAELWSPSDFKSFMSIAPH